MPPGFSARCAACSSPHRPEIDRRLLAGESTRSVSAWLEQQGEAISYGGIARHKRDHLAVAEAVATLAAQAAPAFDSAVQERLNDLALLEEQVRESAELRRLMGKMARDAADKGASPPQAVVQMFKACSDVATSGIKTIREILEAKPEDGKNDTFDELCAWAAALDDARAEGGGSAETVP